METALADQAVVKERRGPTSMTMAFGEDSWKKLSDWRFSGSKVSCSSHLRIESLSKERGQDNPILKHCSVSMATIWGEISS